MVPANLRALSHADLFITRLLWRFRDKGIIVFNMTKVIYVIGKGKESHGEKKITYSVFSVQVDVYVNRTTFQVFLIGLLILYKLEEQTIDQKPN